MAGVAVGGGIDLLVDLLCHGDAGAAVGVPQGKIYILGADGGIGLHQIPDMDLHRAGGVDGLGAALFRHSHNKADILIVRLLGGGRGGELVGVASAHKGRLIVPVIGQGVLVGDVRRPDGQAHIPHGQGGGGVVEIHIDLQILGQGDAHLAIVHGQALGAAAVDKGMGLLDRGVGGMVGAGGRVGLPVAVVGAVGVVVSRVDGDILVDRIPAPGAGPPAHPCLVAVGLPDGLPAVHDMGPALGTDVHRQGGGQQGRRQYDRQQQRQSAPALYPLFHSRFLPLGILRPRCFSARRRILIIPYPMEKSCNNL